MSQKLATVTRGRIYLAPLNGEDDAEHKFWLCVSNKSRPTLGWRSSLRCG